MNVFVAKDWKIWMILIICMRRAVVLDRPLCKRPAHPDDPDHLQRKLYSIRPVVLFEKEQPIHLVILQEEIFKPNCKIIIKRFSEYILIWEEFWSLVPRERVKIFWTMSSQVLIFFEWKNWVVRNLIGGGEGGWGDELGLLGQPRKNLQG